MATRPKSILWVDDEIESLESHRRFLTDHGYAVEAAAHGDDALELLRRQPYGVVLVDEQMPGQRGLELFGAIRSLDPSIPVVMVTKSEDSATMHEAIGLAVDDYLVKPVQPRQVLSVVTRLLDGDRIRQQHLSREFVSRFRELDERRATALGWREWIDLVRELAVWDIRLAEANEPGLLEALRAMRTALRHDFAAFIAREYVRWIGQPERDRPALSP
ncbi:MAG: response regulator, partial [Gemmatimonadota bacterium]